MSGMSEAAKRGRRNWSLEDKWRIVEEAQLPGNSVAEVARRRGSTATCFSAGYGQPRPDSSVTGRIPLCFCRNPPWTSFRSVCLDEAMTKGLR
jgi:transposase